METMPALDRADVTILIVDDNVDAVDSLAMLLRMLDYDVMTAYNGASALAIANEHDVHIVLLDLALPDLDGFMVAHRIRRRAGGDCPVLVALTGYGDPAARARTRAAGFDHHYVKPVHVADLQSLLVEIERELPERCG